MMKHASSSKGREPWPSHPWRGRERGELLEPEEGSCSCKKGLPNRALAFRRTPPINSLAERELISLKTLTSLSTRPFSVWQSLSLDQPNSTRMPGSPLTKVSKGQLAKTARFCLFIFTGLLRREFWSGLPFPSPVDRVCQNSTPWPSVLNGPAWPIASMSYIRLWSMWSFWFSVSDCSFHYGGWCNYSSYFLSLPSDGWE